ncbi:type IV toxin-antitoxin system AbiEi family antitoxin domain-containing protein [candidate division WOR-3 bacterium]|nr:type IV toxin-antitoxin system AbiEi family antitoxin domain-containing protein [candidate division WOR-3 bacterium]
MQMVEKTVLSCIKQLGRPFFTTFELSRLCGKSSSTVIQTLNYLEKQGLVTKVYRGIWADTPTNRLNVFSVVPLLFPRQRAYISFVSALHYHGIVEQVPQVVTVASTAHTRKIKTKIATYSVHRIHPSFFKGFSWDETKSFLVAGPEKALIDSLYLSAHRKKNFGYFPELHFARPFSIRKAREWIMEIRNEKTRIYVSKRFESLIQQ